MNRVAAIDCGTNSIRLLVADIDGTTGRLADVLRRMEIVRLGQGVDRSGVLAEEAVARTFAACESYAADIARLGATRLRFCATSAVRDAANAGVLAAGVWQRLGVDPEVVDGTEEARLSYLGATRELGPLRLRAPYAVFDIGGGSTELAVGAGDGEVKALESIDIGSVRLTERHLRSDPPTAAEIASATADIDAALWRRTVPLEDAETLVGVGGTVTTVAAMVLGLRRYDAGRIHLSRLPIDAVAARAAELLAMTVAQRAALPYMHPGRADVIGAGALIFERITAVARPHLRSADVVVSEHDILDGIAWSLA